MTRIEAAKAGERFYASRPCKHDGNTLRYTASGACPTCAKRVSLERSAKFAALIRVAKSAP